MKIAFELNGAPTEVETDGFRRLLDVLRVDLGLCGTKEGCGEGECGACTVLIDGLPANSCLVPIGQLVGRKLATIEGMGTERLTAVQRALVEHGGTQCGICTPGIAMTATYALACERTLSRGQWREQLAGNLCRCTGYQRVIDAVVAAARAENVE